MRLYLVVVSCPRKESTQERVWAILRVVRVVPVVVVLSAEERGARNGHCTQYGQKVGGFSDICASLRMSYGGIDFISASCTVRL